MLMLIKDLSTIVKTNRLSFIKAMDYLYYCQLLIIVVVLVVKFGPTTMWSSFESFTIVVVAIIVVMVAKVGVGIG
jgi:hypothetical protein